MRRRIRGRRRNEPLLVGRVVVPGVEVALVEAIERPKVFGLEINELPGGVTPLEAFVVVKALDETNDLVLYRRCSDGWSPWELIGVLDTMLESARMGVCDMGEVEIVEIEDDELE